MEKENEETKRAAPVKHSVVYRLSCRDRSREPTVPVEDNLVIFNKYIEYIIYIECVIAVTYERRKSGEVG